MTTFQLSVCKQSRMHRKCQLGSAIRACCASIGYCMWLFLLCTCATILTTSLRFCCICSQHACERQTKSIRCLPFSGIRKFQILRKVTKPNWTAVVYSVGLFSWHLKFWTFAHLQCAGTYERWFLFFSWIWMNNVRFEYKLNCFRTKYEFRNRAFLIQIVNKVVWLTSVSGCSKPEILKMYVFIAISDKCRQNTKCMTAERLQVIYKGLRESYEAKSKLT